MSALVANSSMFRVTFLEHLSEWYPSRERRQRRQPWMIVIENPIADRNGVSPISLVSPCTMYGWGVSGGRRGVTFDATSVRDTMYRLPVAGAESMPLFKVLAYLHILHDTRSEAFDVYRDLIVLIYSRSEGHVAHAVVSEVVEL